MSLEFWGEDRQYQFGSSRDTQCLCVFNELESQHEWLGFRFLDTHMTRVLVCFN